MRQGAKKKVRQTLRFPGRESPFLRSYNFLCLFSENQEMSLVCSDFNKCLLEEVDFLTSKWTEKSSEKSSKNEDPYFPEML